jgi:predicted transcriptional regulator of viral defense system
MKSEYEEKLEAMLAHGGVLRSRDLAAQGIPRNYLKKFEDAGKIEKLSRGIYTFKDGADLAHHDLSVVAKRSPQAVFCLVSALQFHGIGTQMAYQVWMALPRGRHAPRIGHPVVRMFQFSEESFSSGVEKHFVDGVEIKVFSAAKTIADCFARRNVVGLDVCIEALRDCLRSGKASIAEINYFAKICRVEKVMAPYLEMAAV